MFDAEIMYAPVLSDRRQLPSEIAGRGAAQEDKPPDISRCQLVLKLTVRFVRQRAAFVHDQARSSLRWFSPHISRVVH
jgi:hypothetical protein